MSELKRYFEISKVDSEERMVWGYCSTESVDAQGETVTKAAMEAAWDDYMKFANIREMHQPSAVGIVKEYEFRNEGVFIGAHIVDDAAWAKVTAGVYKGFSIGGKKLPNGYDKVTKTISGLKLTEISLVDRPANPEALIEMFKADMETDMPGETQPEQTAAEKLKELVAKGNITPERLVELLEAEVAKASQTAAVQEEPQHAQPTTETQEGATAATSTEQQTEVGKADTLTPLQSALRLVASGDTDAVQKGIYEVGSLANLLSSLRWLQQDSANEAQLEGDGSAVPAKLAACARTLGECLVEMAQEEVGELLATLKADAADKDPLTLLTEKVASVVSKPEDTGAISKGELAPAVVDDEAIAKAVQEATSGLVSKVDTLVKSLETATNDLTKLRGEHDELQKRWNDAPRPAKAARMSISKGQDGDPLTTQRPQDTGPVLKADGSVDVEAEIKKVHASGGRPLI